MAYRKENYWWDIVSERFNRLINFQLKVLIHANLQQVFQMFSQISCTLLCYKNSGRKNVARYLPLFTVAYIVESCHWFSSKGLCNLQGVHSVSTKHSYPTVHLAQPKQEGGHYHHHLTLGWEGYSANCSLWCYTPHLCPSWVLASRKRTCE